MHGFSLALKQKYNIDTCVFTSYIPDSTENDAVDDAQGTSIPFAQDWPHFP